MNPFILLKNCDMDADEHFTPLVVNTDMIVMVVDVDSHCDDWEKNARAIVRLNNGQEIFVVESVEEVLYSIRKAQERICALRQNLTVTKTGV